MATTTKAPAASNTTPVPPPGEEAAKTPPPNVVPTTAAPTTTKAPAVNFSNVNITSVNQTAVPPVVSTGGVEGSYENTTGEVTVDSITLTQPYNEELSFVVFDANGPKDQYGDPKEFITGTTGTTVDSSGKPTVLINETIKATVDPTTNLGSMEVVVQLRDKNFSTKTTSVLVENPSQRASTTRSPARTTRRPVRTTQRASTAVEDTTPAPTTPRVIVTTTPVPRRGERMSQEAEDEILDLFFEALDNTVTEDGTATEDTENLVNTVMEVASQRTTTTARPPVVTQETPGVISTEPAIAPTPVISTEPAIAPTRAGERMSSETENEIANLFRQTIAGTVDEQVEELVETVVSAVTTTTTSTTRRPVTTPRPVTPLGETEIDEVVTAQGPAHIQITDVIVNNTTIEDNVDLTVEISNADHWNFSIDGGSNVRVNSYDLDHQLCADQAFDPHGVDAPPPRFGLSEEEKLFEDALAELEAIAEEQADERSEELIDEITEDLTNPLDEFGEVLEEFEKLLEPIQDAFDRAGVDINDEEAGEALMANDPVLRRQLENLSFAAERVGDFVEVMGAVLEEAIPEILEQNEELKKQLENPDFFKDIAKELLKKLKDGTLTVEDLGKIMSRAPSLGTGGALDELLYRKGWIPPGRGGQWLPPYRGRAPNPRARGFFGSITDSSICSHDAPCDSPSRTVTLTVEPGEHDVLVTALDANYTPLTTASSKFAVNGPSNEVSSQGQLIAALRSFSDVKVVGNFDITKTIEVPEGAKITGVGNPVIYTSTTAFSIKESNVELNGFTISKSRTSIVPTGPGVLIDRPNRNSRVAPSNITIKNITFNGLGTASVDQTSPITILGFNKLDTTPLSDEKLSILGATNQPINNINIEDNVFNISINTAIEAWEVRNLNISNNTIRNSRSNGIEVTNITNSNILSNRINQIAGSGILLQGSRSNNIKVEGNTVSTFGSVFPIAPDGFKTGIGTLNGVNGVEIVSNNIDTGSNFWNAGISVKQGSSNILIDNNLVDNIRDGIYIGDESDSVNVKDNVITNVKRYGIQTYRSWAINILSNNITQSSQALAAFEKLSKTERRTIGIGCGILIGTCNGVTIFSNIINGTYKEENGDSAILVSGAYPITDIDQAGVEYGVYDSGSLTDIYGSPGQQVTDSLIEIIVSSNTHEGEGKLLQSNGARLILPGVDPSKTDAAGGGDSNKGDDVTVPNAATTKLPPIVTTTTPPVVHTTKPPGGIVTGPTTTTTTTQRPKGTIIVVPPTGTNTDGAIDTFIDQNTDLTDNNDLVIINTDPDDETSGFTQTDTGTTPFVGGGTVIIDTDPPTFVTTTTTTTTTPIPVTPDGRTREQIARDNYIDARLETKRLTDEILSRYDNGLIDFGQLVEEAKIITDRYDVPALQTEYANVRYTDGLWKENLLTWIDTRNISPCAKKVSQELIKLMPQDWENNDLYWAQDIIDISGITEPGGHYDEAIGFHQNMRSVEAGGVGVRKAAVLISPSHVLMANHWRYTGGQTLTWVTNSGEEISRTLVDKGIKIDGMDSRVFILNEPVPDTLAIYPLLSPRDDYNDILTGSLVLIGNQQRKHVTGYFLGSDPTITYDSILDQGNPRYNPAIYNGQLKLTFDVAITFLNQWIPKKYAGLADTDRPAAVVGRYGLEKGDSGSPNFILSPNGDPILLSQHQLGGPGGSGAFLGGVTVQEKIRGAMDSLSDKHNLPRYGLRTIDPCTGTKTNFPGIIDEEEEDDDDPIIPIVIIDPEDDVDDDDPIDPIILYTTTPEPDDSGKVVVYSTTPPPRGTTPELPPPARAGCMDPSAENWDPRATVDDGSCVFITDTTSTTPPLTGGGMVGRQKPGCTNPNALNFDPTATFDDGSCIFPPAIVRGCTDPTALNFNPGATFDDGTCRWPIIFEPPTTQPPYIPATCREAPKVPLGETESDGEGDTRLLGPEDISTNNIENRIDIEQEANEPVRKIFPAPINAMQVPFNSKVNFNTNITKKEPTPYGFTTAPPDDGSTVTTAGPEETLTVTTTICPPDNENCNTLQY